MRRTALLFLIGATAIAGLPPLNGFVSEWLVYLGFLDALDRPGGDLVAFAALGVPVLALVGGLAAACFAKVVGVVFLGQPRSERAGRAHEAPGAMLAPMALLAALCAVIGLAPAAVLPPLARAAAAWSRLDPALLAAPAARAAAGAARVSAVAAALLVAAAVLALLRRRRLAAAPPAPAVETWACAFAAPTARMQYTGSSLAELLLRRFTWAIFPRVRRPALRGPFPAPAVFHTEVPDTVLDLGLLPAARAYAWLATRARLLSLRRIQFQMLLVLLTLLAVLAWGFFW
jgi:NADH:ubiquinone oxidoreductase subunit 5 (subunit L)/multisubunit Na+/H+ antiporter MnhA subunit